MEDIDYMDDERWSRQVRYAPIGVEGQRRLAAARVAVLGCGALGCAAAEQLARAGVGMLRLIDRDFVEPSNLQRQCLYTEADAAAASAKAVAAAARLRERWAGGQYEPHVVHVHAGNIEALLDGCDLVIDGADNFPLRHLVNEACCKAGRPWVHAACVGGYALSFAILPGETACLRCLQDELPAAGDGPTCDSAGIIPPAVQLAASWQVAEALKILVGDRAAVRRQLWASDLWTGRFQRLDLRRARDPACAACGPHATYPALQTTEAGGVVLCGRDGVQIPGRGPVDLASISRRLGVSLLTVNGWLLRWRDGALHGTLFRDGRVIVQGTADPARARGFADRWLG
jgi:molybdopterin/thiamine biosynthesis adenylyltransferase